MWKPTNAWPILIAAVIVSLITGGCGPEQLSAPELNLPLPDGWSYQENESRLLMASRSEDLQAAVPEGPRLRIHWASRGEEYQEELVKELFVNDSEEETPTQVVDPPVRSQVDNVRATAIGLQVGEVRQRYIIADPGADHVYTFILEARAGQWEEALPEMEGILETVTFSVDY